MEYTINDIKTIEKCDCGRKLCQYYSGIIGSFTEDNIKRIKIEIQEMIKNKELERCLKHLDKLLKNYEKTSN